MQISQWIAAIIRNDIKFVQRNVEQMQRKCDDEQRSGLMLAAQLGFVQIVQLLLPYEAGMQNADGFTALMIACIANQPETAKLLMEKEVKMKSSDGSTALMCAAASGSTECFKLLLAYEQGYKNNMGMTATMLAAAQGHTQIIDLVTNELLAKDNDGRTCLHHAAANAQQHVVEQLLQKKKELIGQVSSTKKWTALREAFEAVKQVNDYPIELKTQIFIRLKRIIQLLFPVEWNIVSGDNKNTLMLFCEHRLPLQPQLIQIYAKQCTTDNKQTALMLACKSGHNDAVQQLVSAEHGMRDSEGRTAAMYAAEQGNYQALKIVFQYEYQIKDLQGATVMHYAARSHNQRLICELHQSFQRSQNCYGDTPLHCAIRSQSIEGLLELLPSEFTIINYKKQNPLMVAAQTGFLQAVQALIQQPKLLNKVDIDGYTASAYAAMYDQPSVFLQLLEAEGLNKNTQNSLLLAASKNSYKVCKLVVDAARSGTSLAAPGINISSVQHNLAAKLLKVKTSKKQNELPQNYNALEVAIAFGASEAVQVLANYFKQINDIDSITPLMLGVKYAQALTREALEVLAQVFGGMGLKYVTSNSEGLTRGTTALMMACLQPASEENIDIVKILVPFERDCVDSRGMRAVDYAKAAGRDDILQILQE